MPLYDARGTIQNGELAAGSLPPLYVAKMESKVIAIGGNRRLFVRRVCATHGVVQTVRVSLHPLGGKEMQMLHWDERFDRHATKLERSMPSPNGGT